MARKRFQNGTAYLVGKRWYGKYREDVIQADGSIIRVQKRVPLGTKRELPTKRLALRQLQPFLSKVNSTSYRGERIITVAEFVEKWKIQVLVNLKPSTRHGYESHLRVQILPFLGKCRLNELGIENQQTFVHHLQSKTSRIMLVKVLGTLSSMMKTAKLWGYTTHEVHIRQLSLPATECRREARFFEPEQVQKIIQRAQGKFKVLIAICAMTGMRIGEALALQRGDFDFQTNFIHVRRSTWRWQITTPKTKASESVITMPTALASIVEAYLRTLSGDWLFLSSKGRVYLAENLNRQVLHPILDELGIPRCGFHAFRHTFGSALRAAGAGIPIIQRAMRHKNVSVTLGTYGHVLGNEHQAAVERIGSIMVQSGLENDPQTQLIQ